MNKHPLYQPLFDKFSCCVLIPTYNNGKTLKLVLDQVTQHTSNVIVINDGSTDNTVDILKKYPEFTSFHFPKNRGKGEALKKGFNLALERNFSYAISMDSDGQHFSEDLHVFISALEQKDPDRDLLVIGSRKMDGPNIPQKSSIGNRFSSFWFWVETGIKLSDTQCGYRLYPLRVIQNLRLYTSKFELEIEVIVKAAWKGVKVINLPVRVHYDTHQRVTHFRPFLDVTRIVLLNIYFVLVGLFYILPRNMCRKLRGSYSRRTVPQSERGGKSFKE